MTTLINPRLPPPPPQEPEDRFHYGWRYVRRLIADGEEVYDQVPLTAHDVLHPQERDFLTNSDGHETDVLCWRMVAKWALDDDPAALVLSEHRIDLDIPGVEPVGPDVTLILGLTERKRPGATFYVVDEKVKPVLLGEVTSPDTRNNDLGIKVVYYHQAGVLYYIIIDAKDRETKGILRLIGYQHTPAPLAMVRRLLFETWKIDNSIRHVVRFCRRPLHETEDWGGLTSQEQFAS